MTDKNLPVPSECLLKLPPGRTSRPEETSRPESAEWSLYV
ncbi:hypothetical protein CLOSTMETH_01511 [[Clostridium] methylpentosum DSM 5476]|uniref:Uncharacterized protein n=1 Tax=[Clostridium] methylpentosum DSM 5476 TaxID=537013 RepID=C0ECE1_9FIRM|nr:hypothetical protein CLOSTMETH_01511 [[Clostridium] methylpentosum DSM 5476]